MEELSAIGGFLGAAHALKVTEALDIFEAEQK
jgi:hypothetical protein